MEITMYDTLLQLPLFQGLCKNDFTEIIGKVKLHFFKYKAGERIVCQGDSCLGLIFLLKGEIISETKNENNLYTWGEFFNSPYVLEPYSLFGMHTNYIYTHTAVSDVDIVSIEKNFILYELGKYDIFLLNYLNIINNRSQTLYERATDGKVHTVRDKILNFFFSHSERLNGKKILKIKMEDFAFLLNHTRLSVSKALNELQDKELITLRRKEIEIPEISLLSDLKSYL